jgi:hypothetical protein
MHLKTNENSWKTSRRVNEKLVVWRKHLAEGRMSGLSSSLVILYYDSDDNNNDNRGSRRFSCPKVCFFFQSTNDYYH